VLKSTGRALLRALAETRRRFRRSDGLAFALLWLRKLLLYALVLVFLVFEEVWEVLRDLLAFRRYYPRLMAVINAFAARQNRYLVLCIYLSLFVPMELLGLASAALAAEGYWKSALLMYASKGLVAVPAIDIFIANKEKLLSFSLIAWVYGLLLRFKSSDVYQHTLALMVDARRGMRDLVRRFWRGRE